MTQSPTNVDSTAIIGQGCSIATGAVLGPDVELKDHVVVGFGAVLLNCSVGNGCEIAAGCVLDGNGPSKDARLVLEAGVVVLAGAVISEPVHIATGARILAGAVITRDVPPHARHKLLATHSRTPRKEFLRNEISRRHKVPLSPQHGFEA